MRYIFYLFFAIILFSCSTIKKSRDNQVKKIDFLEKKDLNIDEKTSIESKVVDLSFFKGLTIVPTSDSTDVIIKTPDGKEYGIKGAKKIKLGESKDSTTSSLKTAKSKNIIDKGEISLRSKEKGKKSEKEKRTHYLGSIILVVIIVVVLVFLSKKYF